MWKRRKKQDKVEQRFQQAIGLVKDLDRREFNRLINGIELAWQSYNKIRQVQTVDEKEVADIAEIEKELEYKEDIK
jgi:hypothetical protein